MPALQSLLSEELFLSIIWIDVSNKENAARVIFSVLLRLVPSFMSPDRHEPIVALSQRA